MDLPQILWVDFTLHDAVAPISIIKTETARLNASGKCGTIPIPSPAVQIFVSILVPIFVVLIFVPIFVVLIFVPIFVV